MEQKHSIRVTPKVPFGHDERDKDGEKINESSRVLDPARSIPFSFNSDLRQNPAETIRRGRGACNWILNW